MVSIDKSKERSLRKTAHHLEPVVWIGKNGISENVIKEIIQALEQHELIKIKLPLFPLPKPAIKSSNPSLLTSTRAASKSRLLLLSPGVDQFTTFL